MHIDNADLMLHPMYITLRLMDEQAVAITDGINRVNASKALLT